jgi:hypothetical protein
MPFLLQDSHPKMGGLGMEYLRGSNPGFFLPEGGKFPWECSLMDECRSLKILPGKDEQGDADPSEEVRICLSFCHTGVW